MSPPLITCVMLTTHPKRQRFLPNALQSYRQQSYANKELLVVNDGSPLVSHAPDVRVINLPDRGARWTLGEKRNAGIRMARGEFLATWDDDDLMLPHRLDAQMRFDADYILADRMLVADGDLHLLGDCARIARPVQASALIRRDVAVAAGGYPAKDIYEDVEFLSRVRYLARGSIATQPNSDWYVVRRHTANITQNDNDDYVICALQQPDVERAQAQVDAVLAGPGGQDAT